MTVLEPVQSDVHVGARLMARMLSLQSGSGQISEELAAAFPDFAAREAQCLGDSLLDCYVARRKLQAQIQETAGVRQLGLQYFLDLCNRAISDRTADAKANLVVPATAPTVWSGDATLNAHDISYLIHICTQHRNGWPQTTKEADELRTGAKQHACARARPRRAHTHMEPHTYTQRIIHS
jgi:hypothetical protein